MDEPLLMVRYLPVEFHFPVAGASRPMKSSVVSPPLPSAHGVASGRGGRPQMMRQGKIAVVRRLARGDTPRV
jgi:hypothetical protein